MKALLNNFMKHLPKYPARNKVRICSGNNCITAFGKGARVIIGTIAFAFICWGVAQVIRANR